jgi:CBS domain-containing protein
MKAMDVMRHEVERVSPESDMARAAGLMWAHDLGAVVVVDDAQRPLGLVTDRDVAMAAFLGGTRLAEIRVADTLQSKLVTCRPTDPLAEVARSMEEHRVRRVVVIDDLGRLVGLISVTDLARSATHSLTGMLGAPGVVRAVEAAGNRPR